MSDIGKHKLSDALSKSRAGASGGKKGKPTPAYKTDAEQTREAQESQAAKNAEASTRDRMVDLGRGNQQAGRQGS
jgi:hypothetical protein